MRKYFLPIAVFFSFWIAISSAGRCYAQNFTAVAVSQANVCSALSVNYPHSEFEVNYRPVLANSSCRQQNPHAFLSFTEFTARYLLAKTFKNDATVAHVSSKQYLNHIYPSHNFW